MPEIESSPADTIKRVTGLIRRQRWWILFITTVVTIGTVGALYQIPNKYRSEATLIIVPQQVPARYVTPTSETNIVDALEAMTQDVLSSGRLLGLMDEFGLYRKERRRLAPEEVIALMRKYIDIQPVDPLPTRKEINSFKISFVAERADIAQQVTSRLTSFFIEANLKAREDQAANTTNFLRERLDAAQDNLAVQEKRLTDFKTTYLGELPEQQQGNLAILNGAQSQLQNISASLDRAQQERAYLQSLLNAYERLAERGTPVQGLVPGADTARPSGPLQAAEANLTRLESERAQLLGSLKPSHPDVVAIEHVIAGEQAIIAKLRNPAPSESGKTTQVVNGSSSSTQVASQFDASTAQVRSQLESNHLEIENLTKEQAREKATVEEYERRLNNTPVREQQLAEILRDHDLSKKNYEDLLSKEQQSQLAMSLEKQQGGQQFRLVEPANLPALPSSPNRIKLGLGGFFAGLALGLVLAVVVELVRPTFHDTREITLKFGAPLVIGLPLVLTPREKRLRKWKKTVEMVGGSVAVSLVCLAELYVLRHP